MLPSSILIFLFVLLVLASLEDLRIREVPDVLSYFLLAAGLLYAAYVSFLTADIQPIINSFGGVIATYLFGLALMHMNMWGGGDTKLLMGIAAFITTWPPVDLVTYIFLIFFLGAFYGLAWTKYLVFKHWKELTTKHPEIKNLPFFVAPIVIAIKILVFILIPEGYRILLSVALSIVILSLATTYILQKAQDILTIQNVDAKNLVLGDWLVEDVEVNDGTVYPRNSGLTEQDLRRIKQADVESVRVKYGIPFIPSFLVAYIAWVYLYVENMTLLTIMFSVIV